MHDTSPEMAQYVRDLFMAMDGERRFRIGAEMFDTARAIVIASFPAGLSEREKRRLLCRRLYGALAEQAYPDL